MIPLLSILSECYEEVTNLDKRLWIPLDGMELDRTERGDEVATNEQ